ncbi:hypothetical protein GGR70_004245 [Xanthomonas campestris]|jgi:hypothetical protein|nr:hypothetical protein [Xanthomonas campestris]
MDCFGDMSLVWVDQPLGNSALPYRPATLR